MSGEKIMKKSNPKGWLIGAVALTFACILQVIFLIRYVGRLPDDRLGIVLSVITILAFALAAFGFFIRWNKEKA
jgi:hypothetical protein